MSLESVLARISEIDSMLGSQQSSATAAAGGVEAEEASFADQLSQASTAEQPGAATAATSADPPSSTLATETAALPTGTATAELQTSAAATAGLGLPTAVTATTDGALPTAGSATTAAPAQTATLPSATSVGLAATSTLGATGTLSAEPIGERIVQIAQSQIGQSEQPPGSNEGPAIAAYRSSTADASGGEPWCGYFASWVARAAGLPLGSEGQGLGAVSEIWSWAQESGRAIENGPGVTPQPGDLIVFGSEHVGIVKDVLPNGDIQTIEGNYDNQVSEGLRTPTEATGYVDMSEGR